MDVNVAVQKPQASALCDVPRKIVSVIRYTPVFRMDGFGFEGVHHVGEFLHTGFQIGGFRHSNSVC
jgi:hypothetical protein